MDKWTSAIVAIFMVACATPQKIEPEILSAAAIQQPDISEEPDRYLVRINLVAFQGEIAKYPKTYAAFQSALDEWVSHLPIECAFFTEEQELFAFMPFGPPMISSQRGIVRVHFADIEAPPYNRPKTILGYWDWTNNEVVMNSVILETDPDKAYMVALHELGHVFGLSHFLNPGDLGSITGDYIVPATFDARKLVMFPIASDINKCSKLTKLEIALAQKNIPGLQTLGRSSCFHLTTQHE